MKTETKSLLVEKMDEAGHGLARLANLAEVDHDGDTYSPGAFAWKEGSEQWCPMLPAHNRTAMPIGKARVYEKDGLAYAELHLNLDTQSGKEWHASLKFDLATGRPAQEWSYGFNTIDAVYEQRGSDRVRNVKRVDVHEVSPVVRGAGMGTATLAMKSRGQFGAQIDAVLEEIDDIVERAGGIAALRVSEGREMSKARLEQLGELKARLEKLMAAALSCGKCGSTELDDKGVCSKCGGSAEDNGKARTSIEDGAVADQLAAEFLTRDVRRRLGRG